MQITVSKSRKIKLFHVYLAVIFMLIIVFALACKSGTEQKCEATEEKKDTTAVSPFKEKVDKYESFKLTTDLSALTEKEKQMLPILLKVAKIMDELFWMEAYGDKNELLNSLEDEYAVRFAKINYGPWDRLDGNNPFLEGYGEKPAGANFYPTGMTKEEFEAFENEDKTSQYTLIRRNEDGTLKTVFYHEVFKEQIEKAAGLIEKAAELAEDEGLKKYLELRAEALRTDEYFESDMAWMDMKDNTIEFIAGPIENYEDGLFNCKAAHESFILIKDKKWSKKLDRFAALLPELQKSLPVDDKFKQEIPGSDSDLGAYDAIYYAGDCNAGSKTIAINLPNDPKVRTEKGSRKLQLKNSMRAKFDKILIPISNVLIAKDQRKHITFDAFFENVMFHEVGHALGLSETVNGKGKVRAALKDYHTKIEEGKADILGLFAVTKLHEMGEITGHELMDNYVTFMASIFRSIRFGVSSSHGAANMLRFYYFQKTGAFTRDPETGTYRVDFEKMKESMISLIEKIITIQGTGDYKTAKAWVEKDGKIKAELQKDLNRLKEKNIPVDIVFEQGIEALGL